MERLLRIDRRVIFLVATLVVLAGALLRPTIPLPVSPEARQVFDAVEAVPAGGAVIVALDYNPNSRDELDPMTRAALFHAFARNVRVLAVCFDEQGVKMAADALSASAGVSGKREGVDYVFLGYQPDITAAIDSMGSSIAGVYPQVEIADASALPPAEGSARPTAELPVMKGITRFADVALAVEMTGSKSYEKWINFANARYGLKLAIGATGAIVTGIYPFLASDQVSGLLRSTRGAADYENLVRARYGGPESDASLKMSVQFLAHIMVVFFIVVANVAFWTTRTRGAAAPSAGEDR
jgi:hypothetical protein